MSNKYTEAFCSHNNTFIDSIHLQTIRQTNPKLYKEIYLNNLRCPICKKIQLTLVNGKSGAFFRGYANQAHDDTCLYFLQQYKTNDITKLLNSSEDIKKIQNQMQLLLLQSMTTSYRPQNISPSYPQNITTQTSLSNSGVHLSNKRIPQKRIDTHLTSDDFDIVKIFYGSIFLISTPGKKNPKEQYFTLFSMQKPNIKLCSIKATEAVWNHLKHIPVLQNGKRKVYISFCGTLTSYEQPFCTLRKSQLLLVQPF